MSSNYISINMNGILFNIFCDDIKFLEKTKSTFDSMFASSNITNYSFVYNIQIDNNPEEYCKITSKLLTIDSKYISPNIYKYILDGQILYHHYSEFYVYYKDNNYHIISNNSKYSAYYLILELYLKTCESIGSYLFHGNGLQIENNGIDIIGISHSGKTTLMSKLFQIEDVPKYFLSNDRIIVGEDKTLYFPIDLNLDKKTIIHDNYLSNNIKSDDNKTLIKPALFVSSYPNTEYKQNIDNMNFIIPQIDLNQTKSLDVFDLSKEKKYEIMKECCFSIIDKECYRDEWIMSNDKEQIDIRINNLINYIINNYRVLFVNFGCDVNGEEIYERIRKKN